MRVRGFDMCLSVYVSASVSVFVACVFMCLYVCVYDRCIHIHKDVDIHIFLKAINGLTT